MRCAVFNHNGHALLQQGNTNQVEIIVTPVLQNTQAVGQLLHFVYAVILILPPFMPPPYLGCKYVTIILLIFLVPNVVQPQILMNTIAICHFYPLFNIEILSVQYALLLTINNRAEELARTGPVKKLDRVSNMMT